MTDPAGWLVDILTEAWGEPRVQPPAEPSGRAIYRSEIDSLVWVKMADRSRRAWVWFPGGNNCNLAVDKGAHYVVRMGGYGRRAEVWVYDGYWPSRTALEGVARFVYGLPDAALTGEDGIDGC
jgi:hypothetical protein